MTKVVGFDFRSGYGFVNASRAMDVVSSSRRPSSAAPVPAPLPTRYPTTTAPVPCVVTWDVYNSKTDTVVVTMLGNGTIIRNPPPCGRINIEAILPKCISNNNVTVVQMELYRSNDSHQQLIYRKHESKGRFFLFGNQGKMIHDGKIKDGTYKIRAIVNHLQPLPWRPDDVTEFSIDVKKKKICILICQF